MSRDMVPVVKRRGKIPIALSRVPADHFVCSLSQQKCGVTGDKSPSASFAYRHSHTPTAVLFLTLQYQSSRWDHTREILNTHGDVLNSISSPFQNKSCRRLHAFQPAVPSLADVISWRWFEIPVVDLFYPPSHLSVNCVRVVLLFGFIQPPEKLQNAPVSCVMFVCKHVKVRESLCFCLCKVLYWDV